LGTFDERKEIQHAVNMKDNGLYAFVLKGSFEMEGQELSERDGLGIWAVDSVNIKALKPASELLLMEVPMKF
jgi:redox-sensitive bicupin YhaK (pirin superfamily)